MGDAAETFPAATLQVRTWARNNPGRARRVVGVIRGVRDEASLLEVADEPIEEPEEGTEGASTPLDFDSEEGPATEEQENALEAEALTVQSVEGLNEEEVVPEPAPELPPVPVGYAERVRNWVAENPAAAAVFRQAIREQFIQVIQHAGRDDVRNFARNFPRAANAMRQWAHNNPDQAQRAAELVSEIRDAGDGGAALLHEWAAATPGAAAVLRAVTRARLIQFMLHADRNDLLDAAETFPAATLQVQTWARNNPGM